MFVSHAACTHHTTSTRTSPIKPSSPSHNPGTILGPHQSKSSGSVNFLTQAAHLHAAQHARRRALVHGSQITATGQRSHHDPRAWPCTMQGYPLGCRILQMMHILCNTVVTAGRQSRARALAHANPLVPAGIKHANSYVILCQAMRLSSAHVDPNARACTMHHDHQSQHNACMSSCTLFCMIAAAAGQKCRRLQIWPAEHECTRVCRKALYSWVLGWSAVHCWPCPKWRREGVVQRSHACATVVCKQLCRT